MLILLMPYGINAQLHFDIGMQLDSKMDEVRGVENFLYYLSGAAQITSNDYFTIEGYHNGQSFLQLRKVDGAGNSQTLNHFQAYNQRPIRCKLYYPLKKIDFDGEFSFSKVVEVSLNPNEFSFAITAYPNPIASGTVLNLSLKAAKSYTVMLKQADQYSCKIESRPIDLIVSSNKLELRQTDWAAEINTLWAFDQSMIHLKKS